MPLQTFNRPAQGGKRPGAGRSIKEQAAHRVRHNKKSDSKLSKKKAAGFTLIFISLLSYSSLDPFGFKEVSDCGSDGLNCEVSTKRY
jgi:hypothetical protein